MPAYIYHAPKWRQLPGNSIVQGGTAYPMDADDSIVFRGRGYHLGSPAPVEPDPVDCMTHHVTKEPSLPTTSGQPRTYVTVEGAGDQSGRDWANACRIQDLYDRLLTYGTYAQAYIAAGDYHLTDSIGLPDSAKIYGGFDPANPTWETRDAFRHPTRLIYTRRVPAFVGTVSDFVVNGISIKGCASMITDATGQYRMTTINCTAVDCVSDGDPIMTNPQYCYLRDCHVTDSLAVLLGAGVTLTGCKALDCSLTIVNPSTAEQIGLLYGHYGGSSFDETHPELASADISDCMVSHCTMTATCDAYGSDNLAGIIVGGRIDYQQTHGVIRDCTVTACDCVLHGFGHAGVIAAGAGGTYTGDLAPGVHHGTAWIHGCDVIDCTIQADGLRLADLPENDHDYPTQGGILTAVYDSLMSDHAAADVIAGISGCRMINCSANLTSFRFRGLATSVAREIGNRSDEYPVYANTRICNCLDVCCTTDMPPRAFGHSPSAYTVWAMDKGRYRDHNEECIFYISSIQGDFKHGTVLPMLESSTSDNHHINGSLVWQTVAPDGHFDLDSSVYTASSMASSIYQAKLGVYLGIGNSISDFKNTGLADLNEGTCHGRQDLARCPAPWTPEYASWLAVFGDWHPLQTSQLAGKAGLHPEMPQDLDGKSRSQKSTIGAYEWAVA